MLPIGGHPGDEVVGFPGHAPLTDGGTHPLLRVHGICRADPTVDVVVHLAIFVHGLYVARQMKQGVGVLPLGT